MSYGTKSSTSGDSNSVSNDFVSCDNSDKSSEVNSNDFASSDSSVKSSEPKSNDSTSCASTSSISTSESEAEIESNGLLTHLIKDCDFYEKQMANKTVGNGVGPVHSRNHVNHQNQFVPQAVLLGTGKVNITLARPQPVPTGKPKVPTPVPTGSTARPMPHLNRPTSFICQTYTPYVPQVYSNHMTIWWGEMVKLLLSPQQVVLGKHIEKEFLIQMHKIHTDDNVADLLTKAFDGPRVINSPCYHNKELASPEQTATTKVVPKFVAGSSFPAASSTYVVPTGRVIVPTGRYVVPAGKVIIIVSPGRVKQRLMLIED
ncbi:hypothetical protein Tco_0615155 [Tanacetum coccineum]